MSKNLTRKGLAFGALVALASTVIAGTPASAAGEVVFEPSTGTSYNTFITEPLTLAASLAPGQVAGNIVQLKYAVTVPTGVTLQHKVNGAASYTDLAATGVIAGSGSASNANTILLGVKYTAGTTAPIATAESVSVAVTAWLDSDNDGVVDSGEFQQARTIGFKKYSEVVPTVAITAPNTGDASVKATVALADVNVEQLGVTATAKGDVDVTFTNSGTGTLAGSTTKADGVYTDTFSAGTLAGAATVTARATYKTVALGSAAVSATVTARTISSIAANVVTGANAIAATTASAGNSTTASGAAAAVVVRKDSAWVAQGKVLDTATTPVVKAGVAVVATVSTVGALSAATTSAAAVSVTVNGTTYTAKTGNVVATVNLTSDASGLVSLPVATAGGLTSAVVVKFAAQNFDASVSATPTAASYTVTDDGSAVIVATNKNTAVTFNVTVKDQFGQLSARTNERLKVAAAHATVGAGIANQFVTVSAGKASFTVTPITDNVTDITVTPTLEIGTYNAGTGVTDYATGVTGGADLAARTVTFRSAAYAFSTAPAIDATNGINNGAWTTAGAQKQTLTTVDQSNTAAVGYVAPAASTTWAKVTLTGSNAGEKLTVSGTDVFLSIDGAAVAKNSVSKVAQAAAAVIYVASNTTGAKTLTVTNGSVSATVVVTFAAAAGDSGKTITITAPATATPGSTFTVTGKIVDAFGNAVASAAPATFAVTYVGPGFVVGSTLPTATNASGEFSFQVLTGAADAGSGTVTVTYDADGTGTTSAAVVKTGTVLVAAPEVAATIAAATGKINFTIDNAKGELVIIKVANKTVKRFVAYSNAHAFGLKATKGSKAVKVYVAGDLVAAKTVAVK